MSELSDNILSFLEGHINPEMADLNDYPKNIFKILFEQYHEPLKKERIGITPKLREKIKFRDNFQCQMCMLPENEDLFQIHHIDGNPAHTNGDNLITLHRECHRKTLGTNYVYWIPYFKRRVLINTLPTSDLLNTSICDITHKKGFEEGYNAAVEDMKLNIKNILIEKINRTSTNTLISEIIEWKWDVFK